MSCLSDHDSPLAKRGKGLPRKVEKKSVCVSFTYFSYICWCEHVNLLYFAFSMSVLFTVKLFHVKVYRLIFFSPEIKGVVCYPGTVL